MGQAGKAVDPGVWPIASLEVVVKRFCGCDQHLQLSDRKSPIEILPALQHDWPWLQALGGLIFTIQ